MKKIITLITLVVSCALMAQTADVVIVGADNKVSARKVKLEKNGDGSLRFKLPKDQIPASAKEVRVIADFMRAEKGQPGFWIFPRGEMGYFDQQNGKYRLAGAVMPIYAMQSPKGTWMGYVKTLRFEYGMEVCAKDGKYCLYPSFRPLGMGFAPYEDMVIDFYKVDAKPMDYSSIGRLFRKMRLDSGFVKPIKERMKTRKWLEEMALSIPIRIQFHAAKTADKVKDEVQTPENEPPMKVVMSFDKTVEFAQAIKDSGVDKIAICSAGWQSGGYDGRFPQLFPIDKELGGEEALKRYTKAIFDMGFQVAAHTNSTDCYQVADIWSPDLVCKNPDGSLQKGGVWCGGRAYHLCTKRIWQLCLRQQLKQVRQMGFKGSHYVDVFSAVYPNFCRDKNHPATRKEMAEVQVEIAKYCCDLFGGFSSECGFDHMAGQLDYINYITTTMRSQANNPNPMLSEIVPLWEIVYHGIILSTPDRHLQNHTRGKPLYKNLSSADLRFMVGDGVTDPRKSLKLVEFGGRPIFYTSAFRDIPYIKKAFDEFKPVRHLQLEFMQSHSKLAKGVYLTEFGNGERIVCNYNETPFVFEGKTIEPISYILIPANSKKNFKRSRVSSFRSAI